MNTGRKLESKSGVIFREIEIDCDKLEEITRKFLEIIIEYHLTVNQADQVLDLMKEEIRLRQIRK